MRLCQTNQMTQTEERKQYDTQQNSTKLCTAECQETKVLLPKLFYEDAPQAVMQQVWWSVSVVDDKQKQQRLHFVFYAHIKLEI